MSREAERPPDAEGPETEALAALEEQVQRALESGDDSALEVLGYGEISAVLGLATPRGRFACKRLPVFTDPAALANYEETFVTYLDRLRAAGVEPIDSRLRRVERPGGDVALYCVQPTLPGSALGPALLGEADLGVGEDLFRAILGRISGAVGPGLGIDAQLSNWARNQGALLYLDVTTPMLRDEEGREVLDTRLFTASLPWAMRGFVRRFMARPILDKYYDLRGTAVDLLGNLIKEGLTRWVPTFVGVANELLGERIARPISIREVEKYYASDARMWELLQRLRRLDRGWQRRVRQRPYPFLLPPRITRNV